MLWVMERIWRLDEPPLIDEDNEPMPITEQRKEWGEKHGN